MKNYPPFIQKLEQTDPDFYKLIASLQDEVMKPGAIDVKTKFLILLAVDAFAGSSGVQGIAAVARQTGATEAEIAESLRIAYNVAGNKVLCGSVNAY